MPGLKAFGRMWMVASDDFVYPAIQEFIINVVWIVMASVIYATHDIQRTCLKTRQLELFVLGCLVQLVLTLPGLAALAYCSSRGAILSTQQRWRVVPLLHFRLCLVFVAALWDVLGTIWLSDDIIMCDLTSVTVRVVLALVVCNWLRLAFILGAALLFFDPLGSVRLHGGYAAHGFPRSSMTRRLWHIRCQILCCFLREDNAADALSEIAGHMTSIIGDLDLVPSDILAGMVLLGHQHASIDPNPVQDPGSGPSPITTQPPTPSVRPVWMTVDNAKHYMCYALGAYGWPWQLFGQLRTNLSPICRRLVWCAQCRGKPSLAVQDNCCLCNTAALQHCTGLQDDDIIYVSFVNNLYQVAFLVAVDHSTRSVVISIRGTLSIADAITDLCLDSVPVTNSAASVHGALSRQFRAHKGIWSAAGYVYRTLEQTCAVKVALNDYPQYGLTVTGHSLGAGTAALLAYMLRPVHPEIRCFAFSPPGGLVSDRLADEMNWYVMSVVCGDDLVARLSYSSVQRLKTQLIDALQRCSLSKYQLVYRACCNCACGTSHSLMSYDEESDHQQGLQDPLQHVLDDRDRLLNGRSVTPPGYESLAEVSQRRSLQDACTQHTPLYLPGSVLHILHTTSVSVCSGGACCEIQWLWDRRCLSDILITPSMFTDHKPDSLLQLLQHICSTERW